MKGGGSDTMADDAFESTKKDDDEDKGSTGIEPHDAAGDDESVDEGSLFGDDSASGDKGHGSDDEHGMVGEDA
jgi:hypothetical protein